MKNYIALSLIIAGLIIIASVFYLNSPYSQQTRTFSSYTLLTSSWEKYKQKFINKDGRVIDYSQGDITTSESQSYALLQSVWVDDKKAFDLVWKWTKNNLKRKSDNLFGWRWGKLTSGNYGFLENGGDNSASDADTDITLALILAARRWNQEIYLTQAKTILPDLWKIDTDTINGQNYLIAGNWAKSQDKDIINPSYFAPYAWRIFNKVNTNNWQSLINPAYQILMASGQMNLDKGATSGLPPDWIMIDRHTGQLEHTNLNGLTSNYSYDAMRIPWRIAIDYKWNNEDKAQIYLNSLSKLSDDYSRNGKLPDGYSHDGAPLNSIENPAMYGTSLGYFMVIYPDLAKDIYDQKIIRLYSNDTNSFRQDLTYYDENWLWFGAALYLNHIVNF